jgi:adenosyl cobinamide kinase/adenosyl cobinamide phosphate guanylyltransferase
VIGGLTSLLTSWLTQRTQARVQELTRHRRRREELYRTFIEQASQLYINALVHDEVQALEQAADLVKIYSVISQMRVLSSRRVILAAENIGRKIVDTYAAPKKTFPELREMLHHDAIDPLREFGEACRAEFEVLGSASD